MTASFYKTYLNSFNKQIEELQKQIEELESQKLKLSHVGIDAAIVGDFFEDDETHRIVMIGDEVDSKYGDYGVVIGFDNTKFETTKNMIDIGVKIEVRNYETQEKIKEITLTADRLN